MGLAQARPNYTIQCTARLHVAQNEQRTVVCAFVVASETGANVKR